MVVVGNGIFCRYSSGTSKNGYAYKLVEFKSDDYEKCTVNVPDELVDAVKALKPDETVQVVISLKSGFRGLSGDLKSFSKK